MCDSFPLGKDPKEESNRCPDLNDKQHVVLVHGACHGAWCWYKVASALRLAGYRVTVPDLAASGVDARRLDELSTFSDYSGPLMEMVESLPEGERVVLVGHSLGGLNIALAMERFPHRVAAAVFLAAVLPDCVHHPFYPLGQLFVQHPSSAAGFLDTQFSIVETPAKTQISCLSLGPQFLAKIYHQCSSEDLTLARTLIRPASMFQEDLESSPAFSEGRYGSVPSYYVVCRDDEQIPEEYQRWMTENHPVKEVAEIEAAGHMAMLARPNDVCRSLLRILSAVA